MFVPIKVTTDYSMLKSMITIPKLLIFLKKYQINVCGICDENLFGVMEFYNTLKTNDIKPLIGLEKKVEGVSVYLYARNYLGYQSLLKISEELSLAELIEISEHLNVILPYTYILKYQDFSAIPHLYIGYTSEYEKNNALLITDNLVFCPDFKAFFLKECNTINLLESIFYNESLKLINQKNYEKKSFEYYFKEEIKEDKTEEFISTCNLEIPKDKHYIPKFLPDQDSDNYLLNLAKKGLLKRFHNQVPSHYVERLKYELSVIQKMGFLDYFLIVYDYVRFAKTNGILVGAGRGSAVGSLVSYSLGITDVDPLKYHLLFERFLNPDRITMPDIDIDFEESRRDEVIEYVKSRYGEDCVANIMTFGTLKSKLALRCVGKSLEIHPDIIDNFVSKIDAKKTIKENLEDDNVSFYVRTNKDVQKMVEESLKIEGLKKHISTHAAGVVISSVPLNTVIPIYQNNTELLTGVTMNYLEDLGLLKMDFLALRNLTIIKNILELIEQNTKQKLDLNKISLDDKNVLELFTKADTMGIFQFESEGMKSFLKKLKPTKFLDIVSAIALYRPGPMENIDVFIKRKDGIEPVEYLHPDLEEFLEETYGIIVYQEQIMQILVKIGGFSFAEADTIRRAMSKKKKNVIEEYQSKFEMQAQARGYKSEIVHEIFELILKFANYGFNKSHSVSYSLIGYQMAYLKCYYRTYFIANLLNMSIDSLTKTKEYIALAKKYNIQIIAPKINSSDLTYIIKDNILQMPFTTIKGLGLEAAKTIIEQRTKREFSDFFDFVSRTYGKSVSRKTIESLIASGAFDEFGFNHATFRKNIDVALNYAVLSSDLEGDFVTKPTMELVDELEEERRQEEYQTFGFYISNHPASRYIAPNIMKLEQIKNHYNKHVECVLLIDNIKRIFTKKNERMAFLTGSDETGVGNLVVFASIMPSLENIQIGDLVLIEGRVARRFDEYQININKIEKIGE